MLIATVPYVGKRLHLDPDPELNYGSGSEHANNFGSGSTTLIAIIFCPPNPYDSSLVIVQEPQLQLRRRRREGGGGG
jgi:hypothetical protein